MPLRATTASGVPAPVDAALTDRGDRFAAVNPATPIEFPKQADGRIRIGALGVGLEPAGGSGPGVLRDGKVFYANTAKDADTTLLSLPTGAESFTELRSPASPEEIRLGFDLPAGQTLRASSAPHMSAEIVSGKKVIADVSAPTAYDAQKQSLPVTSTIQGSTLVLHVAHRSLDVAYPIVVDPQIGVLEPDGWYWNRYDSPGWGTYQSPGSQNWQLWRPEWGNGPFVGSRGLMTYGYYNPDGRYDYYPLNTVSEWNYYGEFSRYSTAYVYAFEEWNTLYPGYTGGGWTPPCAYSGIYSLTDGWENYAGRVCPQSNSPGNYGLFCAGGNCDAATSPGHYPNYMVFGTQGQGYAANFVYDLYAANVYLTDRDNPTVSGGPPGAWTNDTTFSAQANQTGLGVNQLAVSSPGNPGWQPTGWSSNCSAEPNYHCPATTPPLTATTSGLPEGTSTINATASTLSGHTLTQNIGQVKVDRSPPALAFGGTLTNGAVISQDSTLNVDATDGSNDGNPADARSGVASIDITLDPGTPNAQQLEHVSQGACQGPGCPQTPPPAACTDPDNCSLTAAYTYPIANATDGTHTVQVTATDNLGHTSAPQDTTFVVDTTAPDVMLSGPLAAAGGASLSGASHELDIAATDNGPTGVATSGVSKIDVYVDRDLTQSPPVNATPVFEQLASGCAGSQCPRDGSATWSMDARALGDGQHVVEVVTTDLAGNADTQTLPVALVHSTPQPAQMVTLDQASGLRVDGTPGEGLGASVANVGDVNGDGVDDYLVGAPNATCNGLSRAGAAFVVYGGQASSPLTLDPNQDGSGYIRFCGAAADDHLGTSVAAGGDINGDGTPDLLMGATGNLQLPVTQGHVYAVFGRPGLTSTSMTALASAGNPYGFVINGGLDSNSGLGLRVAPTPFGAQIAGHRPGDFGTEGDVDGSGRDSIVIPASGSSASLLPDSGTTFVIFGKTDTNPVDVTQLDNGGGFRIFGATVLDQAGQSSAIVGDVNNSGKAAILITAPGANAPGRSNAGSAYVVFGKADSGAVHLDQLNQPTGYPGYQITGNTGDNLINTAAGADVNGDGTPDLLLGGAGAAWTLYGKADTSTVDLAGGYAGYKMTAPGGQASGYGTATVANAGDMYGDDGPGALVGFPTYNANAGSGFLVFGQTDNTPIDLGATNSGTQFTRLDGPAAASSSQSADSSDDRGDNTPALLIGAPTATNGGAASGSAYLVGADQAVAGGFTSPAIAQSSPNAARPAAAASAARARGGCYTRVGTVALGVPKGDPLFGEPIAYPYNKRTDLQPCRRTENGGRDKALARLRGSARQLRQKYNPGNNAFEAGNATIPDNELNPPNPPSPLVPVYNSLHQQFATIQERAPGCFSVYTHDSSGDHYLGDTAPTATGTLQDPNGPTRTVQVPGPGNKPLYECTFDPSTQDPATTCGRPTSPGNCVTPNQNGPYVKQARLELGGVGCMYGATPRDYIDMRVKPIKPNVVNVGLQGFLPRSAIKPAVNAPPSLVQTMLDKANPTCHGGMENTGVAGRKRPKHLGATIPVAGPPGDFSSPTGGFGDNYFGFAPKSNSPYLNYQVFPYGQHVIAVSTTGVTGRGGVARAVVPDGQPFNAVDWIPYKDPNEVPAAGNNGRPEACWVYGNANTKAAPIWGWTVFRSITSPTDPADPAGSKSYQCPDN